MPEKWVRAAIMRNLPKKITTQLAMELKRAKTAEEMQSIVNIYLHDTRTGLPRGMPGTLICLTITENRDKTEDQKQEPPQTEQPSETKPNTDNSFNAATTGNRKGENNKGKGYGQGWECGEWGSPRRGCPKFLAKMNNKDRSLSASKGYGKQNKGGKSNNGKAKGGKGKNYFKGKMGPKVIDHQVKASARA